MISLGNMSRGALKHKNPSASLVPDCSPKASCLVGVSFFPFELYTERFQPGSLLALTPEGVSAIENVESFKISLIAPPDLFQM